MKLLPVPTRKVAIMQPYIFPYIGYFQLLAAVDCFILYDDVNFIKGGWINRNQILVQSEPHLFTIPLDKPGSNRKICDIELNGKLPWKSKLLQTIAQNYRRAPCFEATYALIERVLNKPGILSIADLVRESIQEIIIYLRLDVQVVPTSSVYNNQHLSAQARVLDICRLEKATDYVNALGGKELYNHESFAQQGMRLHFLQPILEPYSQVGKAEFVPGLSIIDILMNNTPAQVIELLSRRQLIA